MLDLGRHEITRVEIKDPRSGILRVISYIRYGLDLVWQAVRSCFGSGLWIPGKPWISGEIWKYN